MREINLGQKVKVKSQLCCDGGMVGLVGVVIKKESPDELKIKFNNDQIWWHCRKCLKVIK